MADEERLELRIEQFDKAIASLKLALAQPEDEFLRDSIIKRFELAFETGRKALRQWLIDQGEATGHSTKKDVLDAGFRTGVIDDPDLWAALARYRNDSSHEYDAAKAIDAVAFIRQYAVGAFDALNIALVARR